MLKAFVVVVVVIWSLVESAWRLLVPFRWDLRNDSQRQCPVSDDLMAMQYQLAKGSRSVASPEQVEALTKSSAAVDFAVAQKWRCNMDWALMAEEEEDDVAEA